MNANYIMEEMNEVAEDQGFDVNDYLEQIYWEGHPTVQSECCGEPINDFQKLMISAKVIPSICPACGEVCEFLVMVGPASRPISITVL